jgi:hypothetical protein
MTELHVHGVVPAAERTESASGSVRRISHGDVSALVSEVEPGTSAAARVLRTHWKVLEEAAATATVLPVRFGTVMAGDEAVVDGFLAPRQEALVEGLAQLAGKVQLTVKGVFDEQALMRGVVKASPAVAQLRARVRELPEAAAHYDNIRLGELVAAEVERARERETAHVLGRLEPLAVAARIEPPSTIDAAVHCAFLVERQRAAGFTDAVDELDRELSERVRLRCIGPLPAFSFVGESATAGSAAWA